MGSKVIVGDLEGLTKVFYEGHTLLWKRIVLGFHLDGNWECVEYAKVDKGIYFPPHLHDRTEELYYVMSGDATFITDGVPEDARVGDLVLTRLNQSHAVRVGSDADLELLIVEVLPKAQPQPAKVSRCVFSFPEAVPAPERSDRGLLTVTSFDGGQVSNGGWGAIQRWVVPPGAASKPLRQTGAEVSYLVVKGTGNLRLDGGERVPLSQGSIFVTTPSVEYALESARAEALTLLSVEIKLPQ